MMVGRIEAIRIGGWHIEEISVSRMMGIWEIGFHFQRLSRGVHVEAVIPTVVLNFALRKGDPPVFAGSCATGDRPGGAGDNIRRKAKPFGHRPARRGG